MEYVDGQSLKEKLEAGPLDPDEALGIAVQVATGLCVAHDAGIVHRDIKPGNLMMTAAKAGGLVKIMDFGLAKLMGSVDLTKTGATLGTSGAQWSGKSLEDK